MSMISKQYSSSLNTSLSQLNSASNKATNYRAFNKTSEDPFAATKAYQLRREASENQTYQDILGDTADQFSTATSAMQSIYSIIGEANTGDTIQAINGTMNSDNRKIIAEKLRQYQQALISPSNTKFGDKYIFGGSEMSQPPFSVDDAGNLLYRGINVNTGAIAAGSTTTINGAIIQFGQGTSFDGSVIKIDTSGDPATLGTIAVNDTTPTAPATKEITVYLKPGATNADLLNTLQNPSSVSSTSGTAYDFSKTTMTGDLNRPVSEGGQPADGAYSNINDVDPNGLKKLAEEQSLVDLGMGLKLNADGSVNSQSAFDAAIPGLSFLGYGTSTVDGTEVPNNLYTLLGDIADQLDPDVNSNFSMNSIQPYLDQFSAQADKLLNKITETGTKSNFLTTTKTNLESMGDAILAKDDAVEFVEPEDAIMDYYMQQYAYNAALQMGTKIMSKTIFDFLG
jgi:flagellar hook-associated protein 3